MSSHGTNWLSSRIAGRMMRNLLRSDPRAIRRMIGGAGYPYLVLRFAAVDPDTHRPPFTLRLPATITVEDLDPADQ